MKRLLGIAVGVIGLAVFLAAAPDQEDEPEQGYLVRALFDNGSFIVADEDVRVAGANVGYVEEVDVSLPGEVVSREPGDEEQAGKAVVVLNITDPGFQDFRADASCILRPQSLIGERYVSCQPTMPRGDAVQAPGPLEEIPDGEPGAGQHLLPLENNGTNVDIDMLQNIQRRPYADRFRIILNELGAGFAARGEDIAEIVERADPTLRQVNRVLAILAHQRRSLTRLAVNSEEILEPLSKARTNVTGFIEGAGESASATASRRGDLELALAKFPGFLDELETTMTQFEGFSEAALPVTQQLHIAAPALTRATQAINPFTDASTVALTSFGDAAEEAGPKLAEADPIVKTARDLAISGQQPTLDLRQFLGSTRRTKGFERLMELIYNTAGSTNGFDAYGHFLRTMLVATNCVDYVPGWLSGCQSRFASSVSKGSPASDFPGLTPESRRQLRSVALKSGAISAQDNGAAAVGAQDGGDAAPEVVPPAISPEPIAPPSEPAEPPTDGVGQGESAEAAAPVPSFRGSRGQRQFQDLLDFLMGP